METYKNHEWDKRFYDDSSQKRFEFDHWYCFYYNGFPAGLCGRPAKLVKFRENIWWHRHAAVWHSRHKTKKLNDGRSADIRLLSKYHGHYNT
jgi:hypothetical protein